MKTPSTSRPHKESPEEQEKPEEQAQKGDGDAHETHQVDGQVGEPRHQVKVQADELDQAVFGPAPLPLGMAHGNFRHPVGKRGWPGPG